jgi:hypothetical protein
LDPAAHLKTKDGKVVKNLIDLFHFLKTSPEHVLSHHLSERNHISTWVCKKVGDCSLANQITLYAEKNPIKFVVLKRINLLVRSAVDTLPPHDEAAMLLEEVHKDDAFVAKDGTRIASLHELRAFVKKANDSTISYHVSGLKNDFSDWVRHSVLDTFLASRLDDVRDRESMLDVLSSRISMLEEIESV